MTTNDETMAKKVTWLRDHGRDHDREPGRSDDCTCDDHADPPSVRPLPGEGPPGRFGTRCRHAAATSAPMPPTFGQIQATFAHSAPTFRTFAAKYPLNRQINA